MKITEDFPEWNALERLRLNGFRPRTECKRLIEIASRWLPYKVVDDCVRTPVGHYHWAVIVELEQERLWNFKEFIEGRRAGRYAKHPDRDCNPYKEQARNRSWDRGYLLGLSERN